MDLPRIKTRNVHFRNSGLKGLTKKSDEADRNGKHPKDRERRKMCRITNDYLLLRFMILKVTDTAATTTARPSKTARTITAEESVNSSHYIRK